ncbi:hypothetical protein D3C76_1752730 [compost metagenome]
MLKNQIVPAFDQLRALFGRGGAPGCKGRMSGIDGFTRVNGVAVGHLGDIAVVGRVGDR